MISLIFRSGEGIRDWIAALRLLKPRGHTRTVLPCALSLSRTLSVPLSLSLSLCLSLPRSPTARQWPWEIRNVPLLVTSVSPEEPLVNNTLRAKFKRHTDILSLCCDIPWHDFHHLFRPLRQHSPSLHRLGSGAKNRSPHRVFPGLHLVLVCSRLVKIAFRQQRESKVHSKSQMRAIQTLAGIHSTLAPVSARHSAFRQATEKITFCSAASNPAV